MLVAENKTKISPVFSLIDESFVRNRTANYHLSVQISNDGLSHCVLDIKQNRYIALETFSFSGIYNTEMLCDSISEVINQSVVLKNLFKSVIVSVVHEKSALVPSAFFEKGLEKQYLSFNHSIEADEEIKVYDLKSIDAKNVFALNQNVFRTLKTFYPNAVFNHHSSSLLESLSSGISNNDKKLFVHVQSSHFEIVLLRGKKPLYYNSFRHQTPEDFIYYLLFTCEQLKLDVEKTEFNLLGEIEKSSALYSMLYKYVRNIKLIERSDAFSYAYGFNDVQKHFYHNLLNQYLCA